MRTKFVKFVMYCCMVIIIFFSCKKAFDARADIQFIVSGLFVPQDGDISFLKAAPAVGGHQINCYDKKVGENAWTPINGNEFMPGSEAATDWSTYVIDGAPWWFAGQVRITYCPVLPMRVVVKATEGGYGTTPSYLGIWDGTPSTSTFPITVPDRRLGDKLTLNTDALKALPGYTNLSFTISYTKSVIDVNQTAITSPSTQNGWPTYVYGSTVPVIDQVVNPGAGDIVIYDGLDAKITGNLVIKIHVDNTTITMSPIPASDISKGMAIVATTTKVGWYDSGTINITENDITTTTVQVVVGSTYHTNTILGKTSVVYEN